MGGSTFVFGTEGGDLVHLSCPQKGVLCKAKAIDIGTDEHEITGFSSLKNGHVLTGVLGLGLFEIRKDLSLVKSRHRVGSRFITGVRRAGKDILVATAYAGLWRIVGRRAIMAGVEHEGVTYLASFDHGLKVLDGGKRVPVVHGETHRDNYLNQIEVFDGDVWLGTEGGLFRSTRRDGRVQTQRVSKTSVYDMASRGDAMAVASAHGVFTIDKTGKRNNLGVQVGLGRARIGELAWHGGTLYAGGLDGLYRFDEAGVHRMSSVEGLSAGWITALFDDGDRLVIGTYDEGVFVMEGDKIRPLRGLEQQWVPPHAIEKVGDHIWIGGLGMSPVRVSPSDEITRNAIPARDVNGFMVRGRQLNVLTSDGI